MPPRPRARSSGRPTLTPVGDRASEVSGGGIAYGAGRVFVATGYGELIAVDPASGGVLWRQQLGASVAGAPAVEGDLVYVVGRDSAGWAVDARDGKVRWQLTGTTGGMGMVGSSAPAVTDRLVLLPNVSGELRAVLKTGGVESWKAQIVGNRLAGPMRGDHRCDGRPCRCRRCDLRRQRCRQDLCAVAIG